MCLASILAALPSVESLLRRTVQLEKSVEILSDYVYNDQKVKIIGELAFIYKERVIEYTLFQDDTKYTYVHLVQQFNSSAERDALSDMNRRYPQLNASLVTTVNNFFATHAIYNPYRPTNSNNDAAQVVGKAVAFPFKEGDPDKQFALDLSAVLASTMTCGLLPYKNELGRKLVPIEYFDGYDSDDLLLMSDAAATAAAENDDDE